MGSSFLTHAGGVAMLSVIVVVAPMIVGVMYAFRPTEARLALMRPLSLAGIFAALCALWSGVISILVGLAHGGTPVPFHVVAVGIAEALVPMFVGFGCLTVAWLCVAVGLRRH
jgi:hypothetical protein